MGMLSWYTGLSRKLRLRIGILGVVVSSLALWLDSSISPESKNKTVGEVVRGTTREALPRETPREALPREPITAAARD